MAIRPSHTWRGWSGRPYKYDRYDLGDPYLPRTGANFVLVVPDKDGSERFYTDQTDRLYDNLPKYEEYHEATYVYVRTDNTTEEQRIAELDDLLKRGRLLELD